MKQLAMRWHGTNLPQIIKSDDIIIRSFRQGDLPDLTLALRDFDCDRSFTEEQVREIVLDKKGVCSEGIFLAYDDEKILGTTTGCYGDRPTQGELHMVGVVEEARGKGFGKQLCLAAMEYLISGGCDEIKLTTDDFRLAAIKTYLDLGFLPVLWDDDMEERWSKILSQLGIMEIKAYSDETIRLASVTVTAFSEKKEKMTARERMHAVLNGQKPDRLPMVEWADWWTETRNEWKTQGIPQEMNGREVADFFGLDYLDQFWLHHHGNGFPSPSSNGAGVMATEKDYERIKPLMFRPEAIERAVSWAKKILPEYERGNTTVWFTLEGFFWFPRTLFGIENHLYAFYDSPELMHRINQDYAEYCLRFLEAFYEVIVPEFMTFAEDMSYNHGPMLSKECYDEFVKPYYLQLIPYIKSKGTKVLIDTDGDVEPMIPWFQEAGIDGVLPLERQAGVDVNRIRNMYPEWIMLGGYDKTIMHLGEEAMRKEFERILPAMRSGRYVPAVDHQTPPDVSVENYRIYVQLLREYGGKAAE